LGYDVLLTASEEESLRVLRDGKQAISLILINQAAVSDVVLATARRIRDLGQLGEETPIVVLPSEFENEKEGSDQVVGPNDYKSYITTTDQLENLLKRVLPTN
jgi:CheY-like chemotaxis protein